MKMPVSRLKTSRRLRRINRMAAITQVSKFQNTFRRRDLNIGIQMGLGV